jgi:putative transposase
MSIVKVAIHAVWGTKNHRPFLTDKIRKEVCKHIFYNAKEKKIYIDTIDGYTDHLHCLFYLNSTIALDRTLQLIKGESSKWISDVIPGLKSFGWANDYFAASVNEKGIERVRAYIKNQKAHHTKTTFADELKLFEEMTKKTKPNMYLPFLK